MIRKILFVCTTTVKLFFVTGKLFVSFFTSQDTPTKLSATDPLRIERPYRTSIEQLQVWRVPDLDKGLRLKKIDLSKYHYRLSRLVDSRTCRKFFDLCDPTSKIPTSISNN